jgi:hypothetical protein
MTNASAGLRQQHGYHRSFYRRMFKVSIRVTLKIWFGIDVTATPGACSFYRSSTFCNSRRNAFNYNRTVSNRNEFVEKSPCAKYAATGNDHALNLGNHGFCRDVDTTFDRARNRRRKPENRQCAWARRPLIYGARNEIAVFENWQTIPHRCRPAWRRHPHFAIRANPNYRPRAEPQAGAREPDRARAASPQSRARQTRAPIVVVDRAPACSRIGRNVACPKPAGSGDVHDIAKKSVQLPIVHCRTSE